MRSLKQNDYQVAQKADRENKTQLLKTVKQHSDMQHISIAIALCMVTTDVCGSPASNQLLHPPPPSPSTPTNPIPLHPCCCSVSYLELSLLQLMGIHFQYLLPW